MTKDDKKIILKFFSRTISNLNNAVQEIVDMPETEAPTMERQVGYDNGKPEVVNVPTKDWEILSFRSLDNRLLSDSIPYIAYQADKYLNNNAYEIYSVRRLSDNTVWTVGDKVINDTGGVGSITEFRITQDVMTVNADCYFSFSLLSRLKKPAPLFTTADGVNVTEGDEIYVISYEIGQVTHCRAGVGLDYRFYYSTREAAEKAYSEWLFDQPLLTLNDLEFRGLTGKHRDELKQIAKDKILKR